MGLLIQTNGHMKTIAPAGEAWTLEELQRCVEGYIERVPTPPGHSIVVDRQPYREAWVNEEGILRDMPENIVASEALAYPVVGPCLLCSPAERID